MLEIWAKIVFVILAGNWNQSSVIFVLTIIFTLWLLNKNTIFIYIINIIDIISVLHIIIEKLAIEIPSNWIIIRVLIISSWFC